MFLKTSSSVFSSLKSILPNSSKQKKSASSKQNSAPSEQKSAPSEQNSISSEQGTNLSEQEINLAEQKSASSEQKSTSSEQKSTAPEQKSTASEQKTTSFFASKTFSKIRSYKRFSTSKQKSTSDQITLASSASKTFLKFKLRKKQKNSTSDQNTSTSSASKNFFKFKLRKRFIISKKQKSTSEQLTSEKSEQPTSEESEQLTSEQSEQSEQIIASSSSKNFSITKFIPVNSDFIQGLTGPQGKFKVPGIRQQIEKFIHDNARSTMRQKDFRNDYFFSPDTSANLLEVVKSLMDAIRYLVESLPTIKTILIPNIHDLSRIPAYKTSDAKEKMRISKMIESHNKFLLEHLVKFSRETGVRIIYLKIDKFFNQLQTEEGMACYGIKNGVDAANDFYSNSNSNTNNEINDEINVDEINNDEKDLFMFWDAYHVSTLVHEALANISFEILENLGSSLSKRKRDSFATKTLGVILGDYTQ
ncbi:16614_t:CDS:2 [Racocetra fulgida]|uniref:16614_t:CDS:1 n=1 Tax=Racocetra fulgida TaxID=60492 RepID=A0A9N9GCZ5_9GLOM|nr:16614_t:CDS:2 [Racocetra fulgida]